MSTVEWANALKAAVDAQTRNFPTGDNVVNPVERLRARNVGLIFFAILRHINVNVKLLRGDVF